MKQYHSQQCNIAQLFDQSSLNSKCCWLRSRGFVVPTVWNLKRSKWPRENMKWKRRLEDSGAFLYTPLAHTLRLCINSHCIKGREIWLWYPVADFFWLGYHGNALWQSCNIRLLDQKAFCFLFISHTLGQDSIERTGKRDGEREREGETGRGRQK